MADQAPLSSVFIMIPESKKAFEVIETLRKQSAYQNNFLLHTLVVHTDVTGEENSVTPEATSDPEIAITVFWSPTNTPVEVSDDTSDDLHAYLLLADAIQNDRVKSTSIQRTKEIPRTEEMPNDFDPLEVDIKQLLDVLAQIPINDAEPRAAPQHVHKSHRSTNQDPVKSTNIVNKTTQSNLVEKILEPSVAIIFFVTSIFAVAIWLSSGDTLKDMQVAISDVFSELVITFFLLGILYVVGRIIQRRSYGRLRNIPNAETDEQVNPKTTWWVDFWQGLSTELYGAVLTGVVLGIVVLVFQQYNFNQNREDALILQMGSKSNEFAIEAVRQIRWLDLHSDGSLDGKRFSEANLLEADLMEASLVEANFEHAILTYATLINANLVEAEMYFANLESADLRDAVLQNADLRVATLVSSDMRGANLNGADLRRADLTDARLAGATIEGTVWEGATLPDGTMWNEDVNMTLYTRDSPPEFDD